MNYLLGVHRGFELGHKANGKTRGLWFWAKDEGDHFLVAIDCEGLFDVAGNRNKDAQLAVFSILFSSLLILNIKSIIDTSTLDSLAFFADLTKHITSGTNKGDEDGETFFKNFPKLLFCIRDFQLSLGDFDNDPDKYLQKALNPEHIRSAKGVLLDTTRNCLREFFPTHHCRTLPTPTERPEEQNPRIEADPSVLRPLFINKLNELVLEIKKMAPLKTMVNNEMVIKMNGNAYVDMVEVVLKSVNAKTPPDLSHNFSIVTERHNTRVYDTAVEEFFAATNKIIQQFPVEVEILNQWKGNTIDSIITSKLKHCIGGDGDAFVKKFMV